MQGVGIGTAAINQLSCQTLAQRYYCTYYFNTVRLVRTGPFFPRDLEAKVWGMLVNVSTIYMFSHLSPLKGMLSRYIGIHRLSIFIFI